jgi:hypothetical protein
MSITYRKTAQGQTEIATRALKLGPRLRQALILIDGKRNDDELRKLIPAPADEVLQALLDQGFIEVIGISAAAPPAAAAAPAPAPAPAVAVMLTPAETRQRAVRWLSNALGPYADPVNMKIEKTKTPEDLRAALMLGSNFARQQLGAARAAEFEKLVGLADG